MLQASLGISTVRNPPANAEDTISIPGSGRSPGEGNSNPLQYSCLGNPMDFRSLVSYSPWRRKETDMTEQLNKNKRCLCTLPSFWAKVHGHFQAAVSSLWQWKHSHRNNHLPRTLLLGTCTLSESGQSSSFLPAKSRLIMVSEISDQYNQASWL